MAEEYPFDRNVAINLRTDEAVVLLWYLSREVWDRGERRLAMTFDHPAESHGLQALLQELVHGLMWTGAANVGAIEVAARTSLMRRYAE